jgi:hypothetical protein
MSLAERLKLAAVPSLPIQPSTVYLLAGPSVSDRIRQVAGEKAGAGAKIMAVVKEIVAEAKK